MSELCGLLPIIRPTPLGYYKKNLLHSLFLNNFGTNSKIYCSDTRTASIYRTHFCRINLEEFTTLYQGCKIWTFYLFQSLVRKIFFALRQKCRCFYLNNHEIGQATLFSALILS